MPQVKKSARRGIRPVPLTQYGYELERPFRGATLVADGPGDDQFDISRLAFMHALQPEEAGIPAEKLVRRIEVGKSHLSLNWGQRACDTVWARRDTISNQQWPIGMCVYFLKTRWANRRGDCCGFCLMRYKNGWTRTELWLEFEVGGLDLLPKVSPESPRV